MDTLRLKQMKTIKLDGSYTADELKAKIAELEKLTDWRYMLVDVKSSHYYLGVEFDCSLSTRKFIGSSGFSKPIYSFHNKTQAQLVADKVNLLIEMENWAYANNFQEDGKLWVADWSDENQDKWGIEFLNGFDVCEYITCNALIFGIAVKDEETAKRMLEYFKDSLSVYNKQIQ